MAFKVLVKLIILCVISVTCDDESTAVKVILKYDEVFNMKCPKIDDQSNPHKIYWYKGETKIEDGKHISINESNFIITYPRSGDEGYYTCKTVNPLDGNVLAQEKFNVVGKAYVKVKDDIAVIEGEKLKVECIAIGTLPINISWIVGNKTYTTSEGRVKLSTNEEDTVKNSVLELLSVELTDRGNISCLANNAGVTVDDKPNEAIVYVRVKGKYAAFWPFLGIVLETIILLLLIVVCEKFGKKGAASSDEEDDKDKNIIKENKSNAD